MQAGWAGDEENVYELTNEGLNESHAKNMNVVRYFSIILKNHFRKWTLLNMWGKCCKETLKRECFY